MPGLSSPEALHLCLLDLSRGLTAQVNLARGVVKTCSESHLLLEQSVGQLAQAVETFTNDMDHLRCRVGREVSYMEARQSISHKDTSHTAWDPHVQFVSTGTSASEEQDQPVLWRYWAQEKSLIRRSSQKSSSLQSTEALQKHLSAKSDYTRFGSASSIYDKGFRRWVPLRPGSFQQLVWDCLNVAIIMYDLLSLPLISFGYDEIPAAAYLRLGTACFWLLDFVMNFLQGFQIDGRIELSLRAIGRRYARTWLIPDLSLLFLDWFLIINEGSGLASLARIGKTGRFLRILRLLRLLRLIKFAQITETVSRLTDTVFDVRTSAALLIGKLLLLLGLVCHYTGCAWYAVGTVGHSDLSETWVAPLESRGASMIYRYLASFHWAFSQFTPSSSPYHPRNLREELFNVSLLGLGFVIFTASLGSITSTITAVQKQSLEQARGHSILKRYLSERQISWKLGQQIMTFIRQNRRKRQEVLECDVALLTTLPDNLLSVLRCEVFAPLITKHTAFEHLVYRHTEALQDISHKVAEQKIYSTGEEVFAYGSDITGLQFVFSGLFEYTPLAGKVVLAEQYFPDRWIGEAGLWILCQHAGHFMAKVSGSLLELEAKRLHTALCINHPEAHKTLRQYARLFAAKVWAAREINPVAFEEFGGYDTWQDDGLDEYFCVSHENSTGRVSQQHTTLSGTASTLNALCCTCRSLNCLRNSFRNLDPELSHIVIKQGCEATRSTSKRVVCCKEMCMRVLWTRLRKSSRAEDVVQSVPTASDVNPVMDDEGSCGTECIKQCISGFHGRETKLSVVSCISQDVQPDVTNCCPVSLQHFAMDVDLKPVLQGGKCNIQL